MRFCSFSDLKYIKDAKQGKLLIANKNSVELIRYETDVRLSLGDQLVRILMSRHLMIYRSNTAEI